MKIHKTLCFSTLILMLIIHPGFSQFNKKPAVSKGVKVPPGVKMPASNKGTVKKSPTKYDRFQPITPLVTDIEDLAIWRLQLRIHTANRDKAGTDSKVYVKMTSNDQVFWLSQGGDDRKRNEWEIYDVMFTDAEGRSLTPTLSSIAQLTLGIRGEDAWEFDRVELLVNNPYDRTVTNRGGSRYIIYSYGASQKIANKRGFRNEFSLSGRTLRSHYKWKLNDDIINLPWVTTHHKLNVGFQREVLEEILEGSLGHEMGPGGSLSDRSWGKKRGRTYVGILHKDHFPRDVARLDVDIAPSRLVDVEVKFQVQCKGNNILAEVIDTNIRTNRLAKVFATTMFGTLQYGLNRLMASSVENVFVESPKCLPPHFSKDSHLFFFPSFGIE